MNIHAGPQENIHAVLHHFDGCKGIQLLIQLRIEGAGEQCPVRKAECLHSAVEAHAGRAVIAAAARNALFKKRLRDAAEGSCCPGSDLWTPHTLSAHNAGKLLFGQLRNKFIERCFPSLDIGKCYAAVSGYHKVARELLLSLFLRRNPPQRNILHGDHAIAVSSLLLIRSRHFHTRKGSCRSHGAAARLHNPEPFHRKAADSLRIAHIVACIDGVLAGFQDPSDRHLCCLAVIVGGEHR